MKRYACPVMLIVLAIVAAPVSFMIFHKSPISWLPIPLCLPVLAWSAFLLFGQKRWAALGDHRSVFLGLLYGILAGVAAASFLVWFTATAFSTSYMQYPYDTAAGAILMALCALLLTVLMSYDCLKYELQPFWIRLVTALAVFLPSTLLAYVTMDYFEGILSRYV